MKRILALLPVAAAALTLSLAPASAQNGNWQGNNWYGHSNGWNGSYGGWNDGWQRQSWHGKGWQRQGWQQQGWNNGWNSRSVRGRFSDPSYNSDVRFRANPYRCTEDLGYGRYEYCGW